jgi:hypothetical protein
MNRASVQRGLLHTFTIPFPFLRNALRLRQSCLYLRSFVSEPWDNTLR